MGGEEGGWCVTMSVSTPVCLNILEHPHPRQGATWLRPSLTPSAVCFSHSFSPCLTHPSSPSSSPPAHQPPGHTNVVWGVCMSKDGTRAVSVSHDETIRYWDTMTGALLKTIKGGPGTNHHTSTIYCIEVGAGQWRCGRGLRLAGARKSGGEGLRRGRGGRLEG